MKNGSSVNILASLFSGRKALLASMHGKECVLAPLFKTELNIDLEKADLDTDQFGTFSGEIERPFPPEKAARLKVEAVFRKFPDCTIAVASEGSFFPHPEYLLSTINEELVLFSDRKTGVEVQVNYFSMHTNMAKEDISTLAEAVEFARRAGFPGHGVILKGNRSGNPPVCIKGISSYDHLAEALKSLTLEPGFETITIETDMRACYNPTRMDTIRMAAEGLLSRIKTTCPLCNFPGFGVVEYRKGLPCESCGVPTRLILSHIYRCRNCSHELEKKFPDGKEEALAMYCYSCNP